MDENQLIATVAEILEVDPSAVALESDLKEFGWDSLCDISFIAAVDEESGKTIDPDALRSCSTVADLLALA